jgi:hypothetical protein
MFNCFNFIVVLFCLISSTSYAQLEQIKVFTDYSFAGSKNLATYKADALGGSIATNFHIYENLFINIQLGYALYSIGQDSALTQWKWDFWEQRYKGNVRADTASDKNLTARIDVIQKMDVIPFVITFNYKFSFSEDFDIRPSVGGGFMYYSRRLFLEEHWKKVYTSYNYTYEYSYRNFAPNKTGNPLLFTAGLNMNYKIAEILALSGDFYYTHFLKTIGKFGFDDLPFNDSFTIKLGLTFLY